MKYAVVIERAGENLSAYVPDLPGCIATGSTASEVERLIREAISFHFEGLMQDGIEIAEPSCAVGYVELAAQPE
jgi:predicted RNase H-like HicB family nuclease